MKLTTAHFGNQKFWNLLGDYIHATCQITKYTAGKRYSFTIRIGPTKQYIKYKRWCIDFGAALGDLE